MAISNTFIEPVFKPYSGKAEYTGEMRKEQKHGLGLYVDKKYTYKGYFRKGIEDGLGTYSYPDGSYLSTQLKCGCISENSILVYSDKRRFQVKPFENTSAFLVWEEGKDVKHLAEWHKRKIRIIKENFIDVAFLNPNAPSYTFKNNTRSIEIANDAGPHSELLEKIGFIFFKLDLKKLRNSSADVQETLLAGLLSRHYFISDCFETCLDEAVKNMPVRQGKDLHYFLMVEKSTSEIAGAVFSEFKNEMIKIHSITIDQDFRKQSLGSVVLDSTIRRLFQEYTYSKVYLYSAPEAINWYKSWGFTQMHTTECNRSECKHYALSLLDETQKATFIQRELELPLKVLKAHDYSTNSLLL